jgi:hypothetical protein
MNQGIGAVSLNAGEVHIEIDNENFNTTINRVRDGQNSATTN